MLSVQVDAARGIAILEPQGALSKEDFERAAKLIDPHIEKHGRLNGIVVRAEVRAFKYAEFDLAKAWVAGES